jgi:hypothetical protein
VAVVLHIAAVEDALVFLHPVASGVAVLAGATDYGNMSAAPTASQRVAYFRALTAMSTPSRRTRGTLSA